MKSKLFLITVGSILFLLAVAAVPRWTRHQARQEAEQLLQRELPSEITAYDVQSSILPSEMNLVVPFTVQAPHGNWEMPYQEACEEAAALMAIRYAFHNPILSPEDAERAIRDLLQANEVTLGFPVDQTAEQVADLLHEVAPELTLRLQHRPTLESLKLELAKGNVIIVPAAGKILKNPFFRSPGPMYHMLVLRGYTADGYFIVNDPGTKRGEGYLYPFERVMDAMHDWPVPSESAGGGRVEGNGKDIEDGEKVVLVVEPLRRIKN